MHTLITNMPHTLMTPADAVALAASLQREAWDDGDDTQVVAVHCPKGTGLSYVAILDVDGQVLVKL